MRKIWTLGMVVKVGTVCAIPLLFGCDGSDQTKLQTSVDEIDRQVRRVTAAVTVDQINQRQQLYKDIATNRRLASIGSFMLGEEGSSTFSPATIDKMIFAAKAIKDDAYVSVAYEALKREGFYNAVQPITNNKDGVSSYLVDGQWKLNVPQYSEFDRTYPEYAIKALQHERIPRNTNMCSQVENGVPVAIHALLVREGGPELPVLPDVVLENEANAWRVQIDEPDFYKAVTDYRILVDIRCVVESGA